jgi:hypothetical protein
MKYLFMIAAAALIAGGCASYPDHMGRAEDGTYMEIGPNDRVIETKPADNFRDVGRQSPSSAFTSGNGSLNF